MYGFELQVRERCFEQSRSVRVKEALQITHAAADFLGRRRYEVCVSRARTAYPVLRPTEFAGSFFRAAALSQQYFVHLS